MERGLYIAASGMLTEQVRQDLIANDLANASTPGYKADRGAQRSFEDMMLSNTATGAQVGPLGSGAGMDRMVTDLTPGPLRETGEPLDFAVQGEGFFAVRTEQGVRFTRNGQFEVSPQGTLQTATGAQVLGPGGAPVRVTGGSVDATRVGVFAVRNPQKQGDSLFSGTQAGLAAGTVRSGALEGSGADPTRAMIDMIASLRAFESGQKVITTIDETLRRAANDVASPR